MTSLEKAKEMQAKIKATARLLELIEKDEEGKRNPLMDEVEARIEETIRKMMDTAINKVTKKIEEATRAAKTMSEATAELTAKAKTYSGALKTTPQEGSTPFERNTNIDPRLRAGEAVRWRQLLIDLDQPGEVRERMMNMLITGLTSELNDQLGLIEGYNNYTIKALARMTNGGILLEMSNEEGAEWVKNRSREIEGAMGGGAKIKKQSTEEREAIEEASDLSKGAITSLRWIKPIEDRRKGQR
ncbi:hypothetical protein C0992_005938, partial [Termitomyces sp. T32_za158]